MRMLICYLNVLMPLRAFIDSDTLDFQCTAHT